MSLIKRLMPYVFVQSGPSVALLVRKSSASCRTLPYQKLSRICSSSFSYIYDCAGRLRTGADHPAKTGMHTAFHLISPPAMTNSVNTLSVRWIHKWILCFCSEDIASGQASISQMFRDQLIYWVSAWRHLPIIKENCIRFLFTEVQMNGNISIRVFDR